MHKNVYELLTIAEIAARYNVSESTAMRRMRGIDPAATVDGYQGRRVAAYSLPSVRRAFAAAAVPKIVTSVRTAYIELIAYNLRTHEAQHVGTVDAVGLEQVGKLAKAMK